MSLFSEENLAFMRLHYACFHNADICAAIGHTVNSISSKAAKMGLKKCKGWYRMNMRNAAKLGNDMNLNRISHFKKGHVPWNTGKKMSAKTRRKVEHGWFKKGNKPHNTMPIGTIRNTNNYLEIKLADNEWIAVARYNWEQVHGPVPPGHCIIRIDGNIYNNEMSNLAIVTRAELAVMNRKYGSSSPEIKECQILVNKIKSLTHEKQNQRPS
jgi:hypothetical protein